ncbi:MAG: serine protease [Sandaracinaceae bacterium]|nr:serine protease [Sandaracinaceae bacterium]
MSADDEPRSNVDALERASFAGEGEVGRARNGLEIVSGRQATMELVHGADDREAVTPTTAFPWRAICALSITRADGTLGTGTGFLIAPRTVVTAGHCVHSAARGGWARSIEVVPGRDGALSPYGKATGTVLRSVAGWIDRADSAFDYGAIILSNVNGFPALGAFGYAARGDAQLRGAIVNVAGYPDDKPEGTQWWASSTIADVTARMLEYDIDTESGQSGAPVWREENGLRVVLGIHTGGDAALNSATRIDASVLANLESWRAQGS